MKTFTLPHQPSKLESDSVMSALLCHLSRTLLFLISFSLTLSAIVVTSAKASDSIPDEALDCLIEPWVVSDVGSSVQGVIAKLLVDRGESVKKVQPVAQLESGVENSDVALAEFRADAQSETLAREAELKLIKLELARLEDLHRQKMIPAQQRDEATARYQIASAALAQAQENKTKQYNSWNLNVRSASMPDVFCKARWMA